MNTNTATIFNQAGFKPPAVRFRKDDPRGHEYGFFSVEPNEDGGFCQVTHWNDGKVDRGVMERDDKPDYTMVFMTEKDFIEWAKATT